MMSLDSSINRTSSRHLRALLNWELARIGSTLGWLMALWIVGLWLLQIFNGQLWILCWGLLGALALGPKLGGADVLEGSEEFVFSLPPTRERLFWTRFLLGAIPLVVLSSLGYGALLGEWPQALWGWVADSGMTEPYPASEGVSLIAGEERYDISMTSIFLGPLTLYTLAFRLSALASSAGQVRYVEIKALVYFASLVIAMFITGAVVFAINGNMNTSEVHAEVPPWSWIFVVAFYGILAWIIFSTRSLYLNKEIHGIQEAKGWRWMPIAVLLIFLLFFLLG